MTLHLWLPTNNTDLALSRGQNIAAKGNNPHMLIMSATTRYREPLHLFCTAIWIYRLLMNYRREESLLRRTQSVKVCENAFLHFYKKT